MDWSKNYLEEGLCYTILAEFTLILFMSETTTLCAARQ